MKVEKEERRVNIFCSDGTVLKGFVHINPGERILDFINDSRESFIAVTGAEFSSAQGTSSFRLAKLMKKKDNIILHKASIKFLEEA